MVYFSSNKLSLKKQFPLKVTTIKSSVLLKLTGLSITIINFGGLFALKVGHHRISKQDHQRQQTIASLACTLLVAERYIFYYIVQSILIQPSALTAIDQKSSLGLARRRSHRRLIPFLHHKSINATSFIKFNPPLFCSCCWEILVSAPHCQQYFFLSFLFAVSRILLLNTPSYQHVPQQQQRQRLLLRTHRKITSVHSSAERIGCLPLAVNVHF